MITKAIRSHGFRLVVDALLVLAVVLAILSYKHPDVVNAGQASQMQTTLDNSTQDFPLEMADTTVVSATEVVQYPVILDNETIAAIIAAENAALNPPQYVTSLPVITH